MKLPILTGICLLMLSATALAKTMYVTDNITITMRRGAGMSYKVIAELESGRGFEVIEFSKPWTHIRLEDGREGWVWSQWITSEKPKELHLKSLEEEVETLKKKAENLSLENEELKKENQRLMDNSEVSLKERDKAVSAYEALKKESQNYIIVKEGYEKAAMQLTEQREKAERLETELKAWKGHLVLTGIGTGLLLTGFILGWINGRSRSKGRSSYLR